MGAPQQTNPTAGRRAGGVLIALGVSVLTVLMVAAALAPSYDVGDRVISDLGVVEETALLFNGTLLVAGVGNAVAGLFLARYYGARALFGTYGIAGVGVFCVGVFPLYTGTLHAVSALVAFVGLNLEAIHTARYLDGRLRFGSVLAGLLGLCFLGMFVATWPGVAFDLVGRGGVERLVIYPIVLWAIGFGGFLLGQTAETAAN